MSDIYKHLVIYLDEKLSWDITYKLLTTKNSRNLKYFYRLRNICNNEVLRMFYFAPIHSRIEYEIKYWGVTFETHIEEFKKFKTFTSE